METIRSEQAVAVSLGSGQEHGLTTIVNKKKKKKKDIRIQNGTLQFIGFPGVHGVPKEPLLTVRPWYSWATGYKRIALLTFFVQTKNKKRISKEKELTFFPGTSNYEIHGSYNPLPGTVISCWLWPIAVRICRLWSVS